MSNSNTLNSLNSRVLSLIHFVLNRKCVSVATGAKAFMGREYTISSPGHVRGISISSCTRCFTAARDNITASFRVSHGTCKHNGCRHVRVCKSGNTVRCSLRGRSTLSIYFPKRRRGGRHFSQVTISGGNSARVRSFVGLVGNGNGPSYTAVRSNCMGRVCLSTIGGSTTRKGTVTLWGPYCISLYRLGGTQFLVYTMSHSIPLDVLLGALSAFGSWRRIPY